MVGKNDVLLVKLPQGVEVVTDDLDVADIGRLVSNLAKSLGKSRATHSTEALSKIDKDKHSLANLLDTAKLRCPSAANILNQAEGRDDQ